MKKVLSLIGVASISASTGASVLELQTAVTTSDQQNKNILSFANSQDFKDFQVKDFKDAYNSLSENDKTIVAKEMAVLSNLNPNEIGQYLTNSQVQFVRDNKQTIENMYLLYTSMTTLSQTLAVSTQDLNVDWSMINNFIDLDFSDSNDYTPRVSAYGPEHWWTAIWDWGWRIDFPEGDINIMRVVNLLVSLYDGINFQPLESLFRTGKDAFDYLVNLDSHSEDKIAVLYELIIKTTDDFKKSGVPFTNQLYDILDQFSTILKPFVNFELGTFAKLIKSVIEKEIGMSLEKIAEDYSKYLDTGFNIITIANDVMSTFRDTLPGIVWNFVVNTIGSITNQMIAADVNYNGVYLKFQQFIIPLGFAGR